MPNSRNSIFGLPTNRRPVVMGIVNVTPDSFSDGGDHLDVESAVKRAVQMTSQGAHVIDIGGESSRPGSEGVSEEEELRRVLPVIEGLAGRVDVPLSIDTRRAVVAEAALAAGCQMVNDISACRDPAMPGIIKARGVPIVIMHMRGDPKTMQEQPAYNNVVEDVGDFLRERVDFLKRVGIDGDRIVIDPGIGFGKRFRDNLELLKNVASLQQLGYPVLIGASRKAFLGELLDAPPAERLAGSLAVAAWCHRTRVDMVRVHDVAQTTRLLRVLDAIESPGDYKADW